MSKKKKPYLAIAITLVIIGVILWQQTADENLLPEVEQLIGQVMPETTIPVEQNGFVAMTGFSTQYSKNMTTAGFKALSQAHEKIKQEPFVYMLPLNLPKDLEMTELYELPCDIDFENTNCLEEISSQARVIYQNTAKYSGFIANYLSLQKFSKFAHIAPYQISTSPPYIYINSTSQLLTAQAVLDIKGGQVDKGMKFLLADMAFYRSLLNNEQRTLQETLIAINALSHHYFVLDRLINVGINIRPYLAEINELIKPFSEKERSLLWPFTHEQKTNLIAQASLAHEYFYTGNSPVGGCYANSCASSRLFSTLLYKFHSTLNAIHLDWQPMLNFARSNVAFDGSYIDKLSTLKKVEVRRHSMAYSRLYERYGLFLFKNQTGERQKNSSYNPEGYTHTYVRLYLLDEYRQQVSKLVNIYTNHLSE